MTQKNVFTRNGKRGILPFHEPVQMFPIWERRPVEPIMFIGLDDHNDLEPLWIEVPAKELVLEDGLVEVDLDLEAKRTPIWGIQSPQKTTMMKGIVSLTPEFIQSSDPETAINLTVVNDLGYQPLNMTITSQIKTLVLIGWVNHLD